MHVRAIMGEVLIVARPDTPVLEALALLDEQEFRHIPVVDGERLVGMVSDRDLREIRGQLAMEDRSPRAYASVKATTLADIMTSPVISIEAEESLLSAVDAFIEYGIGALPVIESASERLVGIVSYLDVLQVLRAELRVED